MAHQLKWFFFPALNPIPNAVWIGATDQAQEGVYKWVENGANMTLSSSQWYPGQPDAGGAAAQDCLRLYTGHSFMLGDLGCTNPYNYNVGALCEISAP